MNLSRVVFCDFDGTITTQDTFVSLLEKFAPVAAAKYLPAIFRREISLKEGIDYTLGSIESICYPDVIDFVACQPIRPGLENFLQFLKLHQIPFVVVSGGLRDLVTGVLERHQLSEMVTAVYAGSVSVDGEFLQAHSQFASELEFVAKARVMENYPAVEKIAIGDSVTDINMSLAADLVFARDSPEAILRRGTQTLSTLVGFWRD